MRDELERRWDRVWYGLVLVALGVPTAALPFRGNDPGGARALTAALAVALASWLALLASAARQPGGGRGRWPAGGRWRSPSWRR